VAEPTEIHLHPGDFRFAGEGSRLHTVLGSCVAITVWHPVRRIGGMCHYMLPGRRPATAPGQAGPAGLDGRFADDAVAMFRDEVNRHGTRPQEYEVKIFGGADQFRHADGPVTGVAAQNARAGLELLARSGFIVSIRELGGHGSRRLIFEVATGHVWLRSFEPFDSQDAGLTGRAGMSPGASA
jgi:chemotaxis protein CheD